MTSRLKSSTNKECKPNCAWTVHCLARDDGHPMAVRFCGNCEKIRTVDSASTMGPPAGIAAQSAFDVLCKVYLISDVEAGMPNAHGFTERQKSQITRLALVARRLCPKAHAIAIDFTCEDCLSRALQDMPINKIGVVINEAYRAACIPPDLLPNPKETPCPSANALSPKKSSKKL